jgi:hypothetical protein
MRSWQKLLGAAVLLLGVACSRPQQDLLVVLSGDCEGYLEPCG